MKNIYLIGDSIRFGANGSDGYGMHVKEKLEGIANVYAPNENCRFAQYTLRYLHEWAASVPREEMDVVHWNNGLWDVLRINGDEPLTDIETYGIMLKRVYKRIKQLFPKARIIFALSTSVIEDWANPDFMRYNSEIELYNKKAIEVMNELGVEVNDLYSLSKTFDNSLHSDWVHFGVEGSNILADKVIEVCLKNEK
ncbi:MAG: SGNH/GDSL hydrolase family protein [Clostridia bacterium]|nr:SGNH/GDSL hydrolase family protein [Clostridia bacterium]